MCSFILIPTLWRNLPNSADFWTHQCRSFPRLQSKDLSLFPLPLLCYNLILGRNAFISPYNFDCVSANHFEMMLLLFQSKSRFNHYVAVTIRRFFFLLRLLAFGLHALIAVSTPNYDSQLGIWWLTVPHYTFCS